ncbi:hypothetical protein MKW94_022422 [Papaver nudicaule]|uniref:Protein MIZU-KUSSEI 1 n=1 Tax=Papaver nudicaule TaxID=74823 RepID=A0AA41S8I7_PAPNU|nr:hypothetical protein [Papaver nudicaule]
MKTIMARTSHDSSFSFSSRHFCWVANTEDSEINEDNEVLTSFPSTRLYNEDEEIEEKNVKALVPARPKKSKFRLVSVSSLKSVLNVFGRRRPSSTNRLGSRVIGTIFGNRQGHVSLAFQDDAKSYPAFLIELSTPTSGLIQEMASGLVRIALECDKKTDKKGIKLLEEPLWRSYCNGQKCGFAMMFDCGPEEWKVLKAVEPISIGAGVLPGTMVGDGSEGELMYMRAKFERVVGSKDSEAFYMMNPSGSKGPELSIFLIRV